MNILYIEHYAGSPDMGMEFRPYYLSREWIKMGNKVTIIAGDFSHLRKKNPEVKQDFQSDTIDGIEYVWIKTGEYKDNGSARALTMERFVRKIYTHAGMIAEKWKPNIVIASSTYPLDTYPAQRISKKAKAKYIHEVHDMWPSTLYEVGGMSTKHPFVIMMQIAENSAYKHCDKCVSLLPYSKEYMVEHGLSPDKWVNIQNGVVEEEWDNPDPIPEGMKEFFTRHSDQFIVGYFGGHALSNALDNLLDVAEIVQKDRKNIIFVLVGDGIEKDRLIKRTLENRINNVYFFPSVSKKAIPDLLRHFDCSYMTGISSPLYRFGLCLNKMYDSMMAGIPVICVYDAPETLIKQYGCGYQCVPEKTQEVASMIISLSEMSKDQLKEIGQKGKEAVMELYTYKRLAFEFKEVMLAK